MGKTKQKTVISYIVFALAWSVFAHAAHAVNSVVEIKLPSGKVASAEYRMGKSGKPAVLMLHGFLQTRNFPTVAGAAETLNAAGHTVLAPTLSLGISRRKMSLPCEAAHAHTLEQDVAELVFWTDWLMQRGHKRIVLIGHSFGSVQILSMLSKKQSPAVAKAILISLSDVEVKQDAEARAKLVRTLRERPSQDKSLQEAEIGHCKKYVAPAPALLSYLTITRQSILDALAKPSVPIEVILGSADERMGPDWSAKLAARGVAVRTIDGANHFFDKQHEFDLQDALLQAVQEPLNRKLGQ